MTNSEYSKYVDKKMKKSSLFKNMCRAFLVGGAICALGQLISEGWGAAGLDKQAASTATSISLIFLGGLLTGLNIYDDIARFAGAGTIVPITGFANSIVSPAMEFKEEGFVLGVGAKMFLIAGPVLVYGITSSIIYGLILRLVGFGGGV